MNALNTPNTPFQSDPKVWGPPLWRMLHTITFKYPNVIDVTNPNHLAIAKKVKQIFVGLQKTIPCKACKVSYSKFYKYDPINTYLGNMNALSRWLYRLHNRVNAKLRKQELDLFKRSLHQLDEYSRIYRISPHKHKIIKNRLKSRIIMTTNDPTYAAVKKKFKHARYF